MFGENFTILTYNDNVCIPFPTLYCSNIRPNVDVSPTESNEAFESQNEHEFWGLFICFLFSVAMLVEMCVTLCCQKYGEWKGYVFQMVILHLNPRLPKGCSG